jgi:hypothetical protein
MEVKLSLRLYRAIIFFYISVETLCNIQNAIVLNVQLTKATTVVSVNQMYS